MPSAIRPVSAVGVAIDQRIGGRQAPARVPLACDSMSPEAPCPTTYSHRTAPDGTGVTS